MLGSVVQTSSLMGNASSTVRSKIPGDVMRWPSYRFNGEEWEKNKYQKNPPVIEGLTSSLTIVTYNVWFERTFPKRFPAISALLRSSAPDVICLQEVLPDFVQLLAKEKWIQDEMYIWDLTGLMPDYGVMILSRFPMQMQELILESFMDRSMQFGTFIVNGEEVICPLHRIMTLGSYWNSAS
eukprot:TRINITY_DN5513_c0_g1_i4.p1 TRINITY_DN5513_c0_g1~~TRINITY_DN5513_c0_g1_i4.p1  ORF type:complete len:182 (-),score=23.05 TRINITY_DN5513_c0_g1_i4:435-980(-)